LRDKGLACTNGVFVGQADLQAVTNLGTRVCKTVVVLTVYVPCVQPRSLISARLGVTLNRCMSPCRADYLITLLLGASRFRSLERTPFRDSRYTLPAL